MRTATVSSYALQHAVLLGLAVATGALISANTTAGLGVTAFFAFLAMIEVSRRSLAATRVLRIEVVLPPTLAVLLFASMEKFASEGRTPLEAARGIASSDNLMEITAYGIAAVCIGWVLLRLASEARLRYHAMPLLVLPIAATASALWSLIPLFSFVRGLQLFVPVAGGVALANVWDRDPDTGRDLLRLTLKIFLALSAIGAISGLLLHTSLNGRFSWPGLDQGASSVILGAALLTVVAARSFLRISMVWFWTLVGLFTYCVYRGETRSVLFAVVIGAAVLLWTKQSFAIPQRVVRVSSFFLAVGAAAMAVTNQLTQYLSRSEGIQYTFTTLGGRIPLWSLAVHTLRLSGRWIAGFGYGSPRILLYAVVPWAGTAHNSWVEVAMGVGIIGILASLLFTCYLGAKLIGQRGSTPEALLGLVLFAYLIVMTLVSEGFALPGFSFSLFTLLYPIAVNRMTTGDRLTSAGERELALTA